MENTLLVAKYFNGLYQDENGLDMGQMRMHKMMYLVQRESLMYDKNVLFNAKFRGWKYGPVLLEVRSFYLNGQLFSNVKGQLCERTKELIESVYSRYNKFSSWKLSSLSHNELSWKCSRKGLNPEENGNVALSLADMKVDAARELLRRKKICNCKLVESGWHKLISRNKRIFKKNMKP